MLLTRRELIQVKSSVEIPTVDVPKEVKRDETLYRMFHPDLLPINTVFSYQGYNVEIKDGVALIPAYLTSDFEGMGYIRGNKDGENQKSYYC